MYIFVGLEGRAGLVHTVLSRAQQHNTGLACGHILLLLSVLCCIRAANVVFGSHCGAAAPANFALGLQGKAR